MSELKTAVDALKVEVMVLEAWSREQIVALAEANANIAGKNAELEGAAAELKVAQLTIADLTAQLAAATPGTDETAAILADLKEVLERLDAITPAPAAFVVPPEKPIVEPVVEPVVEDVPVLAEEPVVEPLVLDEPVPVVPDVTVEPVVEPVEDHNGES